ncbi:MAG: FtsX-like permease family protein, partial [Glaciihabitans sp.]|nr:FtsX-like permease family protein [Glaciihabitans sp.]
MPHSRLSLWVGTLSIRRWHAHSKLFALVLTVALVSGSVLSGSLLLVRSAEDAGIRGALASMTAERVDVSVRIINPDSPVAETRSAVDRATELAYGTGVSWTSRSWITTNWVTTPNDLYTYAVELDDPSAAAKLVEGQWPTSPQGIAVPVDAAGSLGVSVGDTVTLDNNGSAVELRVDALYQASPESGVFWENDPLSAAGDIDGFPEPGRSFFNPVHAVGPFIIGTGGVDASAISPAQLEAVEHPSFEATDVAGLAALRERVVEADTGIPLAVAHSQGQLFVDSNLAASLGDVDSGLTATRQLALIVALVLLVVVAVAAFAVTRLLVGSRTAEFDLLRARGASNAQVALTTGLDAVTVGLVVLVASPWGGVLLRAIIVGTPPLSTVGLDRWILPDASAWISSAVVAIIMVGLLWFPSAPRRVRLGRVPAGAITLALRSAVIVAAAVMVWRAITTPLQPGDPLLAATPAVLLVAIALVGGRVTTALTRPAAVLAGRSRGVVAPLAGWFASRGPGRSGGVALVALAVAASVVVLGINATWRQALRDEAAVAVGPAYRIAAQQNPQGPQATLLAGDLRDAAPVLRRETVVRKELLFGAEGEAPGVSVQVLGLSDAARRSLDFGTVAAAGGSAVVDGLPPRDDDDTGPLLPSGVEAFGATVELVAPEGVQAEISVVCEDSTGTLAVYSLGTVTPGTTVVTSTELITTTDERNPTRLLAVTMQLRQDGDPVDPATFTSTVSALSAVTATTAAAGSPISLRDAQGWAGSASN